MAQASKPAAAPRLSITMPLNVGPSAMPHVIPAFIQVMASVMREVGTACSHVALTVMSSGAENRAEIAESTTRLDGASTRNMHPYVKPASAAVTSSCVRFFNARCIMPNTMPVTRERHDTIMRVPLDSVGLPKCLANATIEASLC